MHGRCTDLIGSPLAQTSCRQENRKLSPLQSQLTALSACRALHFARQVLSARQRGFPAPGAPSAGPDVRPSRAIVHYVNGRWRCFNWIRHESRHRSSVSTNGHNLRQKVGS